MFRKIHFKLTALCIGITMLILLVMSFCYLYVSEKSLRQNQFAAFKNDCNTITAHLEQQSVITMEWLSKMEAQGNYSFFLLDNDIPFLFNQLNLQKQEQLLEDALNIYQEQYAKKQGRNSSPFYASHTEFSFYSQTSLQNYFCSVIQINKNSSQLQIVILSSLEKLERQIFRQRIIFLLINLSALILLTLFFFWFTGKMLKPIMENQQKQIQFVAAASHELRTPLAIILSSAECIDSLDPNTAPPGEDTASRQALHGQIHHFSDIIKEEGKRMSSLTSKLLTLSVMELHPDSLVMDAVELDTLLMNVYECFEPLALQKAIQLTISLPEESVPCCHCSKEHIEQVLSILLHNAISYTPEQGTIRLSLSHSRNRFELTVTDNGAGIPDEDKKKIFDRFYRTEKSRSTKGHFGLGLSIAYEIVKAHHGSITVLDVPEGGTSFSVILPD